MSRHVDLGQPSAYKDSPDIDDQLDGGYHDCVQHFMVFWQNFSSSCMCSNHGISFGLVPEYYN